MTIFEIDRSVVPVNDLILAERFYRDVLGDIFGGAVSVEHESTSAMTEQLLDLAERGSPLDGLREFGLYDDDDPVYQVRGVPWADVRIGEARIPLYLHVKHFQEPPPEQLRGTPRRAFAVTPQQMEGALEALRQHRVSFEGPVEHPPPCPVERSIYFKDPSSNFLELCVARQQA